MFQRRHLPWIVAALLGLPAATLAAEPLQHRLRATLTFTEPDYEDDNEGSGLDNEGFGLSWELAFNRRVGLGLSAFTTELPRWYSWHHGPHEREDVRMTPLLVTSIFHMTPGRAVDFYLAPGLAWVSFSGDSQYPLDDGFAPVFEIGFDVLPNKTPFGFHLDLKHIFHSASNGPPNFDSLTVGLGFVVRF